MNFIELTQALERDYIGLDSFIIYMCIEGGFQIQYAKNKIESATRGETVLLPAELKTVQLIPDKHTRILEIYIEGMAQQSRSEELFDQLL